MIFGQLCELAVDFSVNTLWGTKNNEHSQFLFNLLFFSRSKFDLTYKRLYFFDNSQALRAGWTGRFDGRG